MKRLSNTLFTSLVLVVLFIVNIQGNQINADSSKVNPSETNYLEADSTAIIKTTDGNKTVGRLLYVSDSTIVITKQCSNLHSESAWKNSIQYKYNVIDSIYVIREGSFWNGALVGLEIVALPSLVVGIASDAGSAALIGSFIVFGLPAALIGGAIGAAQGNDYEFNISADLENFYSASEYLSEYSIYARNSKEIKKIPLVDQLPNPNKIQNSSSIKATKKGNQKSKEKSKKMENDFSKWHITIGGSFIYTDANQDVINAFRSSGFGGYTDRLIGWSDGTIWRFSLSYNLFNRLRMGVLLSPISYDINPTIFPYEEIYDRIYPSVEVKRVSYSIFAEYIIKEVGIKKYGFEFTVAGGLSYNPVTISGFLNEHANDNGAFKIEENKFGLLFMARLEYYTSENFSFFLGLTRNIISSIEVPEISSHNMVTTWDNELVEENLTLVQHTVNVSYTGIDFGISFHF